MRKLLTSIAFLVSVHGMNAQTGVPVLAPPPSPPSVNGTPVGTGGFATYYYMVVANYPGGAVQSSVFALAGANPTLNTTNFNQLGWQLPPASLSSNTGALTFDVLRLPSPAFTGSCTCSVTTGLTTNTYADKGTSLSSYTIGAPAFGANATMYLDNTDYDFPKTRVSVGQAVQGALQQDWLLGTPHAAALTTYCSVGDIMVEVAPGESPGTYNCLTKNTWTLIAASGSGGTVTSIVAGCGLSGGTITTTGTIAETIANAAHNGAYSIVSGDCGKLLNTNTTATYTLPQAGTAGLIAGWFVIVQNISASSVLTISTTTSTFSGAGTSGSSFTIAAQSAAEIVSNGTNFEVLGLPTLSGGNCAAIGIAGQIQASNGSGLCQQANVGNSQPAAMNTATHNNQLGAGALAANTSGDNNNALGNGALNSNTTGEGNQAIGVGTLNSNITGTQNIAIGDDALNNIDGSDRNIAIGLNAMRFVTGPSVTQNVAIGQSAGSTITGNANVLIGFSAGDLSTGASNVIIGTSAGTAVTGSNNVIIGLDAGVSSNSAGENVAIGHAADASGLQNTIVGSGAGAGTVTPNTGNVVVGYQSGNAFVGSNATILGYQAGQALTSTAATVCPAVFIGFQAGASETACNKLYVDVTNTANPMLKGDFSVRTLQVNSQFSTPVNTVTFSTTPVFNMNLGDPTITLTGNVTSFTVTNVVAGQKVNIQICQDGTGSRTISGIPGNIHGFFTIGSTLSTCSVQSFESFDGTNLYATSTGVINE